jgi:hypothetical protein
MNAMIVAEVSKSWLDGWHTSDDTRILAEKFETAIIVNARRGYLLHSWQFSQVSGTTATDADGTQHTYLTETIVAVFTPALRVVVDTSV